MDTGVDGERLLRTSCALWPSMAHVPIGKRVLAAKALVATATRPPQEREPTS